MSCNLDCYFTFSIDRKVFQRIIKGEVIKGTDVIYLANKYFKNNDILGLKSQNVLFEVNHHWHLVHEISPAWKLDFAFKLSKFSFFAIHVFP